MNPRDLAVNAWQEELAARRLYHINERKTNASNALALFANWFGDNLILEVSYQYADSTAAILSFNDIQLLYGRDNSTGFFRVRGICPTCQHFREEDIAVWSCPCHSLADISKQLDPHEFKPDSRMHTRHRRKTEEQIAKLKKGRQST